MSTSDGNNPSIGQQIFAEPFCAGGVGKPGIQYMLDGRITPRKISVPDHHQVDIGRYVGFAETILDLYARLLELVAHGRINIFITTADLVSQLFSQQCNAAHQCAADTKYMNVQRGLLSGQRLGWKQHLRGGNG